MMAAPGFRDHISRKLITKKSRNWEWEYFLSHNAMSFIISCSWPGVTSLTQGKVKDKFLEFKGLLGRWLPGRLVTKNYFHSNMETGSTPLIIIVLWIQDLLLINNLQILEMNTFLNAGSRCNPWIPGIFIYKLFWQFSY